MRIDAEYAVQRRLQSLSLPADFSGEASLGASWLTCNVCATLNTSGVWPQRPPAFVTAAIVVHALKNRRVLMVELRPYSRPGSLAE